MSSHLHSGAGAVEDYAATISSADDLHMQCMRIVAAWYYYVFCPWVASRPGLENLERAKRLMREGTHQAGIELLAIVKAAIQLLRDIPAVPRELVAEATRGVDVDAVEAVSLTNAHAVVSALRGCVEMQTRLTSKEGAIPPAVHEFETCATLESLEDKMLELDKLSRKRTHESALDLKLIHRSGQKRSRSAYDAAAVDNGGGGSLHRRQSLPELYAEEVSGEVELVEDDDQSEVSVREVFVASTAKAGTRRKRYSKQTVDTLLKRQRKKCASWPRYDAPELRCGTLLSYGLQTRAPFHVDHRIPRCLGGMDSIENYQLLCPTCHAKKTMAEQHRLRELELLRETLMQIDELGAGERNRNPEGYVSDSGDVDSSDGDSSLL